MADLQATYTLPTTPAIKFTVSTESKRSGSIVYYRFKISTAPITGLSYFGYNLKCTATLAGKTVANGVTLKDASPYQWSSALVKYLPSSTEWYSVTGVTSATTVSASMRFYSTQVSQSISSGNCTLSVPAGTAPSNVKASLSASTGLSTQSLTISASCSWGDSGAGKYTYQHSSDNMSWRTISTTTAKSVSFTPSSNGYSNSSSIYFRVRATNSGGLTTSSPSVKYTCASAPAVPTNLKLLAESGKRTDPINLTWSGTTSYYEVRVRYSSDGGKSWTSWAKLDPTTAQSKTTTPSNYTAFTVYDASGILKYAVRAKGTSGLYSEWSDEVVYTVLPSVATDTLKLKLSGEWKSSKAVFVKVNGEWKRAKKVFVKVGGTWR